MRRWILVAALLALPVAARAGAPTIPEDSSVDSALVVCPAGDIEFQAIARIAPGVLAFRVFEIYIDISTCTGLRLDANQPNPGCSVISSQGVPYLAQTCGPFGWAKFFVRGGGVGTGDSIRVRDSHDFTVLATRTTFLSPDQNGDLVVDALDLAAARAKLGTHDPTADFDFDGTVTAADLAVVQAHLGHAGSGAGPVAVRADSWGRIKALFR